MFENKVLDRAELKICGVDLAFVTCCHISVSRQKFMLKIHVPTNNLNQIGELYCAAQRPQLGNMADDDTGVPKAFIANGTSPLPQIDKDATNQKGIDKEKEEPTLNIPRHITYWTRCLKTYLPPQYASMDANRMMIAYFTFLSLDLLKALSLTEAERTNALDWIYLCQHHEGGFRGSPGVDLDGREAEGNKEWDVASIPATFFALSILAILRDDFSRVRRRECLNWLGKLQRADGSFGEHLGEGGVVEGGMDTRFGFCAVGIRWMLRGEVEGEVEGVRDIDVDGLIECIRLAQVSGFAVLALSSSKHRANHVLPCHRPSMAVYQNRPFTSHTAGTPTARSPVSPSSEVSQIQLPATQHQLRHLLQKPTAHPPPPKHQRQTAKDPAVSQTPITQRAGSSPARPPNSTLSPQTTTATKSPSPTPRTPPPSPTGPVSTAAPTSPPIHATPSGSAVLSPS